MVPQPVGQVHHQKDRRNPAFTGLGCPGFNPFKLVSSFAFTKFAFDAVTDALFFTIPFALLFQFCGVFLGDNWRPAKCLACKTNVMLF